LNIYTKEHLEFAVNGTGIPEVDFDIGESYAGLLPIGDANENAELYFWFFPSTSEVASKEILIWVTGGVSSNANPFTRHRC
jgi:carboxypeptidase D